MLLLLVLELNDVGRVSSVVVENDEDVGIFLRIDGRVVERLLLRTANRKLLHETPAFHVAYVNKVFCWIGKRWAS